jgi:hypothetical protein
LEKYWNCEIYVFGTGDKTVWCFEVYMDGKLIGESNEHETHADALKSARQFARWYVA